MSPVIFREEIYLRISVQRILIFFIQVLVLKDYNVNID